MTSLEHWMSPVVRGVIKSCLWLTTLMHVRDVTTSSATTPTVDVLQTVFLRPRPTTPHGSAFSATRNCKYYVYFHFSAKLRHVGLLVAACVGMLHCGHSV